MFWGKKDKGEERKTPPQQDERQHESDQQGWFSKLSSGLSKSTNKITQSLSDFVTKRKLDDEALEALEEALLTADLGPKTAATIIEEFAKTRFGKEADDQEIREALAEIITDMLAQSAAPLEIEPHQDGPFVLLMTGVNGAGKTTTIGKIAAQLTAEGRSVMIAAGDTFRAAAVEQLQTWAERAKAQFYAKNAGADAASVAYEAYNAAKEQNIDVLLVDTAGRLQNKSGLMQELQKITRVLQKNDESIPHETLLILDATTGQNAYSQVEIFKNDVDVTGLIVTKLDGSAKGGVIVGLADQFQLPIYAIGVGERIDDLRPFNAQDFARALMGR